MEVAFKSLFAGGEIANSGKADADPPSPRAPLRPRKFPRPAEDSASPLVLDRVVISAPLGTRLVRRSASVGALRAAKAASARPPVLVIDDMSSESDVTVATLDDAGFVAVAESEGDAALKHARHRLTRLVVSELYVPCAEGVCVVTVLKGDRQRLPRLQVLVHTRHTTAEDTDWALAAGCDALVPKGMSAAVLIREVRRLEGFAA